MFWQVRKPRKDGSSRLSDAYEFLTRTGQVDDILHRPPVIPDLFSNVWHWYLDIKDQRQDGNPISWQDIHAYFSLVKQSPSQCDIDILQQLDRQFLDMMTAD